MKMSVATVSLILLIAFAFTGYGNEAQSIDYSQHKNWLALETSRDKEVDVFYVYPSVWQKTSNDPNMPNNSEIDDPTMIAGAKGAFQMQATAFEPIGNIYAPYYRQYDAGYVLALSTEEQYRVMGGTPTLDVVAAFDHYVNNYNNGRPFILAGHSQGSNVLLYLLSGYMKEHPEVYKKMIVAYVIGYPVTNEYLADNPHLKFATGPDDIGVIVSYNTEYSGYSGKPKNPVLHPGALAINPINWNRDETRALETENLGSLILDDNGNIVDNNKENYADAQIFNDTSRELQVIKCSTVEPATLASSKNFPTGVFHSYDYPFYFYNIRENASNRVKNFLEQ